jgi:hypothetical protein
MNCIRWTGLALAGLVLLAGCALTPLPQPRSDPLAAPLKPAGDGWQAVSFPGKTPTQYAWAYKDGRMAIGARADSSASMWRRKVLVQPERLGEVNFSWWVTAMIDGASVADADREDASARVLFAFDGDSGRLSARNRMMFELAEAVTGEAPPYATLMYVWDATAPVGSVIPNPRTDRVRKIVVDSGRQHLGQWRDHRRDLAADFRRVFGEEPGPLLAIAVMTDTDNTRSVASAWYGPVVLH